MQFLNFKIDSKWYSHALALRNETLRRPIGLDLFEEDLSREAQYLHFGTIVDEQLVAYVLIVPEDSTGVTLRQMCVAPEFRAQGIGRFLVQQVERFLLNDGVSFIQMAARVPAIPFYEKLGYRCVGEQFLSVGIPHIRMEKILLPA
ncbi:GNAT family N-acetyltransferase [Thalassoglobus sp.]|uniref:GNAT family N-acetyltransferase n=1 Tax=Thalassoglobus sp. TaxID=2795869 RepID=UPI003AA88673